MSTTTRRNAPKSIHSSNPNYNQTARKMRAPQVAKAGPPLPQLYIDTITAAFGAEADLHMDVLKISPDAAAIEQRIAYFKRGREIMKEAGSHIKAPKDLPPPIRARLKAINMAYDIVSNPEWMRQYEARNESPRIKSGVRFNDDIQEHVFQREPWEEAYMREKRERRLQRLKQLEDEAHSLDSFWADLLMDMEKFELGLDGFLQAFPDPMGGPDLNSMSDDSSFPDSQSFSSWLSGSYKKEEPEPNDDVLETTSYMSSFNPFADETPKSKSATRNNVRSPTSLQQELSESSRVPRAAQTKEKRNSNSFRNNGPASSNAFPDQDDVTNTLDISPVTNPFDDDDDATNPFEDGALDITPPVDDSPDDVSNPFSEAASDSRFSIGTFQKMQKARRAARSSGGSQLSRHSMGAFDNPNVAAAFGNTRQAQRQSKNPFQNEGNDVSGDHTSVFDGLEDVWEDEGVHVDGVSVISDLSESVVAKMAKQRQQPFDPFENGSKGGTRGSYNNNSNKVSSVGNPSWGGSENAAVGFTAAASAIAACCANMVADCQKNTQAMASLEMKNFKAMVPGLFPAEQQQQQQEKDPFDEMEELFSEMDDELGNGLGEF